ncbi:hypothetical protein ES705_33077 [subsurface metagenome]
MNNSEIYKESMGKLLKETDSIGFHVKLLKHKNQELTADNDKQINLLLEELEKVESLMEKTLTESKEDAIKQKCGWAHFRVMKDKIIYTDGTIGEIETKYPAETDYYIKISKSLKLNPLKKAIEDGEIILTEMTREPQPMKFEYKFTGE